jgi:NO-binding membrane sensor protein with MHYT domain
MSDPLDIDLDRDGVVEEDEVDIVKRRVATHRKIALVAMAALIASGGWIIGVTETEKIEALGGVLDLYWITLGGVVATYMGAEIWASKN